MASGAASLRWLWLSAALVVADQLTKQLAEAYLQPYQPLAVTSFFNLTLAYNTGAAFDLLSDAGGWQRWLFIVIAVVVVAVLTYWLAALPRGQRWTAFALALVIGGALGNLIDRVATGRVVDFLDFHVAGYHWPAFNVADSAISVGAVLLIAIGLLSRPPPDAERAA